ncbi:MAG: hypothetical protein MZV63_18150 [Marinilabiliales bacterium]|nr:hypothetical protein [Marinilabiliales bacterium]
MPEGKGPFPAVVLITGSGAQNRDEEIFGHKPFWVLADHLTRRGIAVLRCDDRGVGKSTGSFASATSEDFASDAWAAWQTLSARPGHRPEAHRPRRPQRGRDHRADAGRRSPRDRVRRDARGNRRHRRAGHARAGRGHHEGRRRHRRGHRLERGPAEADLHDPARGDLDGPHRRAAERHPRGLEGSVGRAGEAVRVAVAQVLRHLRSGARAGEGPLPGPGDRGRAGPAGAARSERARHRGGAQAGREHRTTPCGACPG